MERSHPKRAVWGNPVNVCFCLENSWKGKTRDNVRAVSGKGTQNGGNHEEK